MEKCLKNAWKTVQSEILISVDFMFEIVRDKFEISSIYGCSSKRTKAISVLFMIWLCVAIDK